MIVDVKELETEILAFALFAGPHRNVELFSPPRFFPFLFLPHSYVTDVSSSHPSDTDEVVLRGRSIYGDCFNYTNLSVSIFRTSCPYTSLST